MVVKQTNCNTIWLLFAYPTYIHPINSNNMLNIRFTREVVIEGNTEKSEPIKSDLDVINISCCSEGAGHINYALKVVSAIVKKSTITATMSMSWGNRSSCDITINGKWSEKPIESFLTKASSTEAIAAGNWTLAGIHKHKLMMGMYDEEY